MIIPYASMLVAQNNAANFHTDGARSTDPSGGAGRDGSPDPFSAAGRGVGSSPHNSSPIATPAAAVTQNVCRHPNASSSGATTSGARPAPSWLAASIAPAAVARRAGVVRSDRALKDAPGNSPCPTPNSARITSNATSPQARPVSAVNTDHSASDTTSSLRAPNRSASSPPGIWHSRYTRANTVISEPCSVLVSSKSAPIKGRATAIITRST
ncbi:MAG TPA: hypothetical protein VM347_06925 [Nonomuraea sp.]|nr:hypothetical protein [Nonomuraea sp.]